MNCFLSHQSARIGNVVKVFVDFSRVCNCNNGHAVHQIIEDASNPIIVHTKWLLGVKGYLFNEFLPLLCETAADKVQAKEKRQKLCNIASLNDHRCISFVTLALL